MEETSELSRRFWNEAQLGWLDLESHENKYSCEIDVIQLDTLFQGNQRIEKKCHVSWRRRPNCFRLEKHEIAGPVPGRINMMGTNADYYFRIARIVSESDQWRLIDSGPRRHDNGMGDPRDLSLFTGLLVDVYPNTTFHAGEHYKLVEIGNKKGFSFGDAKWQGSLACVNFNSMGKYSNGRSFNINGTILFDPDNRWALRGYEAYYDDGFHAKYTNELSEPDSSGFRRVRSSHYKSTASHGTVERSVTVVSADSHEYPASDFRLASFDLPDPLGTITDHYSRPLILLIGVIITGGTAFWRFRRKGRTTVTFEANN